MSEIRKMDDKKLSDRYEVRPLRESDLEAIYELSRGNTVFYEHHPPFVTRESIREDMTALPPGRTPEDKHYVGFRDGERLVAIMDLVLGYPEENVAFIGLFMTDVSVQGRGVGSGILAECMAYLKECGFAKIRLGVDKGNPQSYSFWSRNGFRTDDTCEGKYIVMERDL